jgi:hypothetical protein
MATVICSVPGLATNAGFIQAVQPIRKKLLLSMDFYQVFI